MNLVLLLLAIVPADNVEVERVDRIEVNHYWDEECEVLTDQVIFWRFDYLEGRYVSLGWRCLPTQINEPERDPSGGASVVWFDRGNRMRKVTAPILNESFTTHDPAPRGTIARGILK